MRRNRLALLVTLTPATYRTCLLNALFADGACCPPSSHHVRNPRPRTPARLGNRSPHGVSRPSRGRERERRRDRVGEPYGADGSRERGRGLSEGSGAREVPEGTGRAGRVPEAPRRRSAARSPPGTGTGGMLVARRPKARSPARKPRGAHHPENAAPSRGTRPENDAPVMRNASGELRRTRTPSVAWNAAEGVGPRRASGEPGASARPGTTWRPRPRRSRRPRRRPRPPRR